MWLRLLRPWSRSSYLFILLKMIKGRIETKLNPQRAGELMTLLDEPT
jgi:hypothetical protein